MATLLLLVIYVAFIGLGIPDSLFGTAWPAIYPEFSLPFSFGSFVTFSIACGTVVSSLLSARFINRFGTAVVTAVSTTLTALALLGFSLSENLLFLCLFSLPLGLGAGAIDAALNNYVAMHYSASHMSYLHCFYGIGVTISPYLMSLALSDDNNWRSGYRLAFFLQAGIALITILSFPLWKKVRHSEQTPGKSETEENVSRTLSLRELFSMRDVRFVWLAFISSCALEWLCGSWCGTFLVEAKGMSPDRAAAMVTFYYLGIALGRFLSGVLSHKFASWKIIHLGEGVLILALAAFCLPLPAPAAAVALFLIGFGNGPIYPNLTHLTPIHFGKEISQSVMGSQMAAAYLGIMLAPPLFGLVAQRFGSYLLPYFLLAFFVLLIASTLSLYRSSQKKAKKQDIS